jgi:zinc-ribbon domain
MSTVTCPHCRRDVSDRARVCPHCGRPMATAPRPQPPQPEGGRSPVPAALGLGLIVIAAVVIGTFWSFSGPSTPPPPPGGSAPESPAQPPVQVGDEVILDDPDDPDDSVVLLAVDDDAWDQLIDARAAQDNDRIIELVRHRKVIRVHSGARVRVIETMPTIRRVQLPDGRSGWIEADLARKP